MIAEHYGCALGVTHPFDGSGPFGHNQHRCILPLKDCRHCLANYAEALRGLDEILGKPGTERRLLESAAS